MVFGAGVPANDGGGEPPPYMMRFRRGVAGIGAIHHRAATWGRPYVMTGPALTPKIPNSSFLRRRKVRLPPFPPDGENSGRSLAPPFPNGPAAFAAGLRRGPLSPIS